MADHPEHQYLLPSEIAELLRVSYEKVMGWIRRAELRAVNISDARRPRYRVSREHLDELLKSREVQPPAKPTRTVRRERCEKGGPIDPVLGEKLIKTGQATKFQNAYYRVVDGVIQFF